MDILHHRAQSFARLAVSQRTMADGREMDAESFGSDLDTLAYASDHYDRLTGLLTRAALRDRLPSIVERAQADGDQVALLIVDLDQFARTSTQVGHDGADGLLRAVANRLRAAPGVVLAARLDTDEFALVLRGEYDASALSTVANGIVMGLRKPFTRGELQVSITASLGSALFPNDALSTIGLLRRAEAALFYAKNGGRDRAVRYDRSMRTDLARTVRANVGQGNFVVRFQPIVGPRPHATMMGIEALMRWQHPEQGLLQPGAFASLFDNPEVAILLGESALDSALSQYRTLLLSGVRVGRLSVNISAAQLRWYDFADQVAMLLDRHAVPGRQLVLELPRDVAMDETRDALAEKIAMLREIGIGLAFERACFDRGIYAGHLSAGDWFKIALDPNAAFPGEIVAEAACARAIGAEVVIERVERADQYRRVAMIDVAGAQGFAIARPMGADEIPAFVATMHDEPEANRTPTRLDRRGSKPDQPCR